LDAARDIVRTKGFNATSIDELCNAAGVTKGAFFHHFANKDALGVAVAEYWTATTTELFANAAYHAHRDPLARIMAYIDFRGELLAGEIAEFTCLVGTMVQEVYQTSDAIRAACNNSISGHAQTLAADFAAAIKKYESAPDVTADSLALHTQTVLQGAFIMAKAKGDVGIARESVAHLKRYMLMLFKQNVA
jgi:TetR/AcrR family transcriptional repressor of nem operon